MARSLNRVAIAADIEVVYSFVTTPAFWVRWHPSTVAVHGGSNRPLLLGEHVTEEFSALGRRHRVAWTVTERVAPYRWAVESCHTDLGTARLTYTFAPCGAVTALQGELAYHLPNPLMRLLGGMIIRRRLASESAEAARRLKELLEAKGRVGRMSTHDWHRPVR